MVSSPQEVNMGKSEVSRSSLEVTRPKQVVWLESGGDCGPAGCSRSVAAEGRGVVRVEWKM